MRRISQATRILTGCGLALAIVAGASVATAQNVTPKPGTTTKDPAGTETIMASLRAWFKSHDLDSDGSLDKDEIAKAYGYKRAFDYKPAAKTDSEADKDKEKEKTDSKSSEGSAETKTATGKPINKAYANRPDYLFFAALSSDGEKVTKDDFEKWAHDYAVQMAKQQDANQKLADAQKRAAQTNLTNAQKKSIEAEIKHQREAMNKMNSQMRAFEQQMAKMNKPGGK